MPSEYYSHGAYPAYGAPGSSASARAEFDAVDAGFAKLPALAGNGDKIVVVNPGGTAQVATNTLPAATRVAGNATDALAPVPLQQLEQYVAFKNLLMNGDFRLDEHNLNASIALSTSVRTFVANRWHAWTGAAGVTAQVLTSGGPAGFPAFLRISAGSDTAGNGLRVQQFIEGPHVAGLLGNTAAARPVACSIRVRSSITGAFSLVLLGSSRYFAVPLTINAANTWETKLFSIPAPILAAFQTGLSQIGCTASVVLGSRGNLTYQSDWTSVGALDVAGVTGQASLTTGSTFDMTGIQLEAGVTPSVFEYRPLSVEQELCARYFQRLPNPPLRGVVSGVNNIARLGCPLRTRMRVAPQTATGGSLTITGSIAIYDGGSTGTVTAFSVNYSGIDHVEFDANAATGSFTTLGRSAVAYSDVGGALLLNAEL